MSLPIAIVLVVDRLGAGFLGPYGNTWVETQHCNRLASQSLLCEFAFSDSSSLEAVYRSYWTGLHAMSSGDAEVTLPALASSAGLRTILLTDDPNQPGFTRRDDGLHCYVSDIPLQFEAIGRRFLGRSMGKVALVPQDDLPWFERNPIHGGR